MEENSVTVVWQMQISLDMSSMEVLDVSFKSTMKLLFYIKCAKGDILD